MAYEKFNTYKENPLQTLYYKLELQLELMKNEYIIDKN